MKRMMTQGLWEEWKTDKNLFCKEKVKIMFRAEMPVAIYASTTKNFKKELLIGWADNGEIECMCDWQGTYVRAQSEGRVWFKTYDAVHPVERSTDSTYVSLERPARLSPEMEAIMRMVRKNELDREKQREENARIQEDLGRITAANIADKSSASRKASAAPKTKTSEDTGGVLATAEKSDGGEEGDSVPELDKPTNKD